MYANSIKLNKFIAIILTFTLVFALGGFNIAKANHDWALSFDGVDDYLDLGNDASLDLSGDFEVTININDDDANYVTYINRIDTGGAYNVYWYIGSEFGNTGKIEVGFGDGANYGVLQSDIAITDGKWHEVTWKKTGNDHKIFIDGVDHTGFKNLPGTSGDINPATNIYVGGDVESDNYYAEVVVDEVKITVDGTVEGHWELNEGSGATALDNSGNNNTANISGATWVAGPSGHQSSGGGSSVTSTHAPIVELNTKLAGIYSGEVQIDYTAYDIDSTVIGVFGFHDKDDPINIYYSSDFTKDIAQTTWHPIETGIENTGTYMFDTTQLPDGPKYRIKIEAVDSDGEISFAESDFFGIDNTGPTYDVELLTPRPIKERDTIELKIISSEDLISVPSVKVNQSLEEELGEAIVGGSGKEFIASYKLGRGTRVELMISGKDKAGNTGDIITSGKNFSITQFGPPPPVIENIADGTRTGEQFIDINGLSEPGTRVVLTLNGVETFSADIGADGKFLFEGIELSSQRGGENTLSFIAFNEQNEDSAEVIYKITLNSAPQVAILNTFPDPLSGNLDLLWDAFDLNGDILKYTVQFSNDSGFSWGTLAEDLDATDYTLDTKNLADGNYIFRVLANDGFEVGKDISSEVEIANGLPKITLNTPPNLFTSDNSPVLSGNVSGSLSIDNVEFSLDEETWINALPVDGNFGGINEDFEIIFDEVLDDDAYNMLIRAKLQDQSYIYSAYSFNVDNTPPEPPSLLSPPMGGVVSSEDDEESEIEGIQTSLSGITEPGTRVQITVNGRPYNRIALEADGSFNVSGVDFVDYGINTISIVVLDQAGNRSSISGNIVSDNLPEILILNPQTGAYLAGSAQVDWEASDPDGDPLLYTLQYRESGGPWINIIENFADTDYNWNLSSLSSAQYQLRVIANDSLATSFDTVSVFIDNIAPGGTFGLVGEEITNNPRPSFSGNAVDNFSGVEFVEYSFDGSNWFTALITSGYRTNNASFRFSHRFELEDDSYDVRVRATDRSGNVGFIGTDSVQVETIPPRVGSYVLSHKGITLFPEGDMFNVLVGAELKFKISLESDTTEATLRVGEQVLDLIKNPATSLWETTINTSTLGVKDMFVSASDFADNSILDKKIGMLNVREGASVLTQAGNPIEGAVISVFTSQGRHWQASEYDMSNPVLSDHLGHYSLLLPAGDFYLTVEKKGYNKIKTPVFNLLSPRFINTDFTMQPREGVRGFIEDIIERVQIF
ncbi:MAG: LamG-like jellyroll fold domain-containing protein [Candidatus Spechtbacterales bacterium]|nr:LamG-like jellyroll fold domain-containing protein [Candidatus Spechtbacterales bacterium]